MENSTYGEIRIHQKLQDTQTSSTSLSFTNALSTYLILSLPFPSTAMNLMDFNVLVGDLPKMCLLSSMMLIFPTTFSSAFYLVNCSNGYSLDCVIPEKHPPPKSLLSIFSLSDHGLLFLVIQVQAPQLFLDLITTSSPLAHLYDLFLSTFLCLHFPHYSTLN